MPRSGKKYKQVLNSIHEFFIPFAHSGKGPRLQKWMWRHHLTLLNPKKKKKHSLSNWMGLIFFCQWERQGKMKSFLSAKRERENASSFPCHNEKIISQMDHPSTATRKSLISITPLIMGTVVTLLFNTKLARVGTNCRFGRSNLWRQSVKCCHISHEIMSKII